MSASQPGDKYSGATHSLPVLATRFPSMSSSTALSSQERETKIEPNPICYGFNMFWDDSGRIIKIIACLVRMYYKGFSSNYWLIWIIQFFYVLRSCDIKIRLACSCISKINLIYIYQTLVGRLQRTSEQNYLKTAFCI